MIIGWQILVAAAALVVAALVLRSVMMSVTSGETLTLWLARRLLGIAVWCEAASWGLRAAHNRRASNTYTIEYGEKLMPTLFEGRR